MICEPNPMQPMQLAAAPRCHARTRSGTPCQCPAVKGRKRCRMHGGTNRGAPKGPKHGQYRHGFYTHEGKAMRKQLARIKRTAAAYAAE